MPDPSDRNEDLSRRVPRAGGGPDNDNSGAPDIDRLPMKREDFERDREEMKRHTNVGRLALFLAILLALVGNLYLTRQNTLDIVENINWTRMGQGSMETDVAKSLTDVNRRLTALEAQNKQLLETLERMAPPPVPAVTPPSAPPATPK